MNKKIIFVLFLVVLMVITSFNIYDFQMSSNEDFQAEIQQLQHENKTISEENNKLKQLLVQKEPVEVQSQYNPLLKQISTFVKVAFVQSKETYPERKKQAEKIMSHELRNIFFPTDTYKGDTRTGVNDVHVFIEASNLTKDHATVLVRLKHTLYSLENEQKQVSPVFIEIQAQRQNEQWIVMDFTEI
ncbi:hypothetical protein [Pseudalkalibacillus hwajinpoensis]|uniref:hypothetical protein n=1 Tax=Guptibacillus hwajinpoensis TaxID=208199 RepID=UPI00384EFBF2